MLNLVFIKTSLHLKTICRFRFSHFVKFSTVHGNCWEFRTSCESSQLLVDKWFQKQIYMYFFEKNHTNIRLNVDPGYIFSKCWRMVGRGARLPNVKGLKESIVLKWLYRRHWCFKGLFLELSEGDQAASFILKHSQLKGIQLALDICGDGGWLYENFAAGRLSLLAWYSSWPPSTAWNRLLTIMIP